MNRLQKFIETGAFGEGPARIAYALGSGELPKPASGMRWRLVETFHAGDELLENAGLKDVFKAAIADGCALVYPTR